MRREEEMNVNVGRFVVGFWRELFLATPRASSLGAHVPQECRQDCLHAQLKSVVPLRELFHLNRELDLRELCVYTGQN